MEAAAREGTIDQTMKRLEGYPGASTLNTQPWGPDLVDAARALGQQRAYAGATSLFSASLWSAVRGVECGMQLLRYEEGQYYTEHHDQIAPRHSAWGPRIYTFFIYLSDEGGATRFTKLNLSVTPAKGSAIL
ncbi:MAG: hypothetical protein SGPRY_008440, partial [Prymnesium sp.]